MCRQRSSELSWILPSLLKKFTRAGDWNPPPPQPLSLHQIYRNNSIQHLLHSPIARNQRAGVLYWVPISARKSLTASTHIRSQLLSFQQWASVSAPLSMNHTLFVCFFKVRGAWFRDKGHRLVQVPKRLHRRCLCGRRNVIRRKQSSNQDTLKASKLPSRPNSQASPIWPRCSEGTLLFLVLAIDFDQLGWRLGKIALTLPPFCLL